MAFIQVTTTSAHPEMLLNTEDISRVISGPLPGCRIFLRSTGESFEVAESYQDLKQRIRVALAVSRAIAEQEIAA